MSSKKQIETIEKRRQQLIEGLLSTPQMLRGSFSKAYRKCGKPNCWCVHGQGHPSNRISWTEKATSRTKAIPENDIDWAKAMTGQYKRFRKARHRIRALDKRLNIVLDDLEEKIVRKSKKCKRYLD